MKKEIPVSFQIIGNLKDNLFKIALLVLFFPLLMIPYKTSTMNTDPINKKVLPTINFSTNKIKSFNDSISIESISNLALRVCNDEEKLRIVHIGDSHIQADIFTGEVRKLLSSYFNDSSISKGFCFPFGIIGSNNPENLICKSTGNWQSYKIKSGEPELETGISGVSIKTSDSLANIEIVLKKTDYSNSSFDIVKIYFENDSLSYLPIIDMGYEASEIGKNSITYRLSKPINSFSIELKNITKKSKYFLFYGLELLNSKSNIVYHTVGVNGADVKSYLTCKKFGEQLRALNPDIAIVSLGTNDSFNSAFNASDFLKTYSAFISRIKEETPNAIIILTTPGDHLLTRRRFNPNIQLACEQIEKVAFEKNCLIWDFNTLMGGSGSIKEWARQGLSAPDHLHFSKQGYRLQGALFFDALVNLFENKSFD